jgi:hypothetical protein
MTILTSYDWTSDTWAHHNGDNPARKAFREAVEQVAAKAREKLPEAVNGRIDAACKIVIQGDVELLPGDKARVGSQSNGTTSYHIVDGTCDCRDFEKATDGWCKHRIAMGIFKRASALAKEQLQASDTPVSTPEPVLPPVEAPVESEPLVAPVAHSEAPASANAYVLMNGHRVQVTLRDYNEEMLLERMAKILERFPADEPKADPKPEGWCSKHNAPMKLNHGKRGAWWSHKTVDGQWCNNKK